MIDPLVALGAGALTVAAPCVLPILPVVLGASAAEGAGSRPLFIALGFATAFAGVGLVFAAIPQVLGIAPGDIRAAGALLLIAFGLGMVWPAALRWLPLRFGWLDRIANAMPGGGSGRLGAFALGTTLGVVWTPCAGPVLASILVLVAAQPAWSQAGLLLALYAVGAALPMLAIGYGGRAVIGRVRALTTHAQALRRGFGVLVAVVGVLSFTGYDALAAAWLTDVFTFKGGLS